MVRSGNIRVGVVVFPGSNCDYDALHALGSIQGAEPFYLWHKDCDLQGADAVILPGGFSYGDYLRAGAIARFSPIMQEVAAFAQDGGLVLGICNGFQILTEAHILDGALLRNVELKFICHPQYLLVERNDTPFTCAYDVGQVVQIPVNHNQGNWTAGVQGMHTLEERGLVVFRYCNEDGEVTAAANPNGAMGNVAGIINEAGNVLGMMPHPERVCEDRLGGTHGRGVFESMVTYLQSSP